MNHATDEDAFPLGRGRRTLDCLNESTSDWAIAQLQFALVRLPPVESGEPPVISGELAMPDESVLLQIDAATSILKQADLK